MTRRRLTWNGRMASAPPAMPGYQEPSVHPAAYPDPEADAYENGDPSSWAEDPHPGPYPNTMHPALPGTEAPMGHPATDPAHYFPAGVSKQASRQLRAAMEVKAAKCIRIAQSMLGRAASVSAIEDQALDLMNLTERQIQAALKRIAEDGMAQDVPTEASDLLAFDNYTLTPERSADDELLAEMMAEEDHEAGHYAGHDADDELLAEMMSEEAHKAMHMASRRRRAFGVYDQMPGDQNAPAHYNFRAEGVLASKKSEEDDKESEEMLAEMVKEEKKASLRRLAKKSEEHEGEEHEGEENEAAKKASARKAAIRRLAGLELSAEAQQALAALIKAEDLESGEEHSADDFMMDDMGLEDPMLMDDSAMGVDELSMLYGGRVAKKSEEKDSEEKDSEEKDSEEKDSEEKDSEDEEPKAGKKAAVRPQPRKASNGLKTLGAVSKVASSDVNDLSKLWESAPDVSKIFG